MTFDKFRIALFAGAMGAAIAAAPAMAQSNEEIQVTAPRLHTDTSQRLNGPLEKVSMSTAVPYDDLNLRSRRDARELRMRVRDSAQDLCAQLGAVYPVYELSGTNCYKSALQNAELKADEAIRDARDYRYRD